ncbi:AI-2E family transporter [Desulfolutivibrio sulfoxidireducens]|uniref:AI-2E family transporter n=1 Tax=Desulfolutivibrio sulfoxidireducens TaxID=2773299 RepID=UPI00159DF859|nr:AI-2E family transporter [Desulfolutivibrio sulfoxidireducens]QLA16313.1 AI-2E family transporter [Desulfolutivibrio sulfoxidireducens]QLA19796.1 AI-2E family transporter [Desulfolutivibrio sulfoxidireducens]
MDANPRRFSTLFFLATLAVSLFLAYIVLRPFVHLIVLGTVLATLFHPIFSLLRRKWRNRGSLAALATVAMVVLLLIVPLLLLTGALLNQGMQTLSAVQNWLQENDLETLLSQEHLAPYLAWLKTHAPFLDLSKIDLQGDLIELSKQSGQIILDAGTTLLGNALGLTLNFFILVFILFFLIRDGESMLARIKYLMPLREEQEDRLIKQFGDVSRSVVMGSFLIAVCQGLAGSLGLYIVGIPPLFWGFMMGFTSLIPIVGTAIIWIPAAIYLGLTNQWEWGLFLAAWGAIIVSGIDSVLRPLLLKGRSNMSMFYVFLSILGGIKYFGALGILYGPLIVSLAMVMLSIYSEAYRQCLDNRD